MYTVKEIIAVLLATSILLGPLAAGMIGARTASPVTVEKSGATPPRDTAPPANR